MSEGARLTRKQMRERGLLDAIPHEATSPVEKLSQTQEIALRRPSRKEILEAERAETSGGLTPTAAPSPAAPSAGSASPAAPSPAEPSAGSASPAAPSPAAPSAGTVSSAMPSPVTPSAGAASPAARQVQEAAGYPGGPGAYRANDYDDYDLGRADYPARTLAAETQTWKAQDWLPASSPSPAAPAAPEYGIGRAATAPQNRGGTAAVPESWGGAAAAAENWGTAASASENLGAAASASENGRTAHPATPAAMDPSHPHGRVSVFDRFEDDTDVGESGPETATSPAQYGGVYRGFDGGETWRSGTDTAREAADRPSLQEQLRNITMADTRLSDEPEFPTAPETRAEPAVEANVATLEPELEGEPEAAETEEPQRRSGYWAVTMAILVVIGVVIGVLIGTIWVRRWAMGEPVAPAEMETAQHLVTYIKEIL
ncbi:hypothetical protein [Actinobaculum suis]|uniref:hypothetical protein n=1 Tax=Actinobaculum suis TaxID=1657 RepID=UPI00066FC593|nr:hypothetical protein [Actinobaculum suis]KMY23564.1 hypothetical protein ACU19_03860 [Actinobaculum suis]OCA96072.1 hypothetical protein ACU20_03445 [Actinobaculum suis]OCA96192.1 hypothetical protein ACU21_02600 [Actinobaculum suis]